MSIDMHAGVIYGVGGSFNKLEELPGKLKELSWDDLYSNKEITDGVIVNVGGSQMTGEYSWTVHIKDTRFRVDKHGENYPHGSAVGLTKLEEPVQEELGNLVKAIELLELWDAVVEPGWLFTVDIS